MNRNSFSHGHTSDRGHTRWSYKVPWLQIRGDVRRGEGCWGKEVRHGKRKASVAMWELSNVTARTALSARKTSARPPGLPLKPLLWGTGPAQLTGSPCSPDQASGLPRVLRCLLTGQLFVQLRPLGPQPCHPCPPLQLPACFCSGHPAPQPRLLCASSSLISSSPPPPPTPDLFTVSSETPAPG